MKKILIAIPILAILLFAVSSTVQTQSRQGEEFRAKLLTLQKRSTAPTSIFSGFEGLYTDSNGNPTLLSTAGVSRSILYGNTTTRTATTDGTTTGTIAANTIYATITSDNANKIVILPAPVVGQVIRLFVGATGYELRSSAPATIAINGGTGTNAESAIGANVLTTCTCTSATTWVCYNQAANGALTATEVAAP